MPLTTDEKTIFDLCVPFMNDYPILFDVGAYKGDWTKYVLSKFPEAKTWLFEPNSELAWGLLRRNLNVVGYMLGNKIGEVDFYRCTGKADEMSSAYNRKIFKDVDCVKEKHFCITVDQYIIAQDLSNIDFLKVDVEGAELDVLKGSQGMLRNKAINFIQVEYGGTYPDAGITFKQVLEFVNELNYNVYELIDEKLRIVTRNNFVEDYRFANFLITPIIMTNEFP